MEQANESALEMTKSCLVVLYSSHLTPGTFDMLFHLNTYLRAWYCVSPMHNPQHTKVHAVQDYDSLVET